jgi:hypothetical protein
VFEAYSVAIRVSLINGVASGLMQMSRQFAKVHGDVDGLQKRLDRIKSTMLVGGVMVGAGLGIFGLIGKTLPAGMELANQMSLINTLGMKQVDVFKALAAARSTAYDVPTTTTADALKSFRELRGAFGAGREGEAMSMLPTVARVQGIMHALTGKDQEGVGFDMVKAIELRSPLMTSEAIQRNAALMAQTVIAMGGTVNVKDFHGALKMGKMATMKWSDDFTYSYLPTLMQEMKVGQGGAQTAGTALMSLYQQMHGQVTKSAMSNWIAGGLISQSDIIKNATGQYQMRPGAVHGIGTFESNPFLWVQQYLRPAVDKITAKTHVSPETAIQSMFSNRNAQFAAYTMYVKAQQFERDKTQIGQADSLGAYNKLLKTNPELAMFALQQKWQDLKAQIGFTIMPDLLKAMQALLPMLQDFTKYIAANPDAVRKFVKGLSLVAGLFTAAGTVMLIKGTADAFGLLFRAVKGGGSLIRAVSGPLGAFFKLGFKGAATGIGLVRSAIAGFGGLELLAIASGIGLLASVIGGMGTAIARMKGLIDGGSGHKSSWMSFLNPLDKMWGDPWNQAGPAQSRYVAGPHATGVAPNGKVYLDGKILGEIVSDRIMPKHSAPRGSTSFDGRRSVPFVTSAAR